MKIEWKIIPNKYANAPIVKSRKVQPLKSNNVAIETSYIAEFVGKRTLPEMRRVAEFMHQIAPITSALCCSLGERHGGFSNVFVFVFAERKRKYIIVFKCIANGAIIFFFFLFDCFILRKKKRGFFFDKETIYEIVIISG